MHKGFSETNVPTVFLHIFGIRFLVVITRVTLRIRLQFVVFEKVQDAQSCNISHTVTDLLLSMHSDQIRLGGLAVTCIDC